MNFAPKERNAHLIRPAIDRFSYNLVELKQQLEEKNIIIETYKSANITLLEKSTRDAIIIEDLHT
jgi:anthranilate/para-aminobenzoate synthase component II